MPRRMQPGRVLVLDVFQVRNMLERLFAFFMRVFILPDIKLWILLSVSNMITFSY